ncbi:MAG: hypothetical protein A3G33_01980 [Omnitrophica bacterium RIFCSPLOWO2_12_FULL_44_17]|uniref:Uncharacterized protein n=1 Tax=Candidatus Danuiimicrobium aquiferis TaxID=1801832 RepID=A0A1G1KT72_9BACT|nr:MAG: hypothetical protein A3B72_04090 [Omnitrophica bacterium RIFCSPHIGHO2_02_FULL_45_28]OGW91510.1 MAG: hypothetical protein A3E74_05345 [Omnitrophica bacterium RIFCSPHIGHO2_12_FULL_44_12]OGW96106.1 MAG: hypothetical protein A3G33_01980 [Omnitrophica bacterium RIFCSPLOWO2_12_FULL_44_17]OGX04655.1 MAG: hypothetical protein A3J12_11450 [Omnitrophica bacterium RIFCSPLOWO2_02_FULL_44_11]
MNCDQSFAPLLNQGAKDKPCVAKIQTIFALQLLRAEFLINNEKTGLILEEEKMKKVLALIVICCFILSMSPNVYAKSLWDMAASPKYGEKALGMFGRGLLNAASCFVDIPVGTVNGAKRQKPQIFGAVGGFATGCMCAILRAASGIIDVATFWVPGFNGMPVCRTYGDCLECFNKAEVTPIAQQAMPAYQGAAPQVVYPDASVPANRMKYVKK